MILYITFSSDLDTVQLWVNAVAVLSCTCDFIKEQNEVGSLTGMFTFPMKTADYHLITSPLSVSLLIGTYHFIIGRSGEASDEPAWNDMSWPQPHTSNIDTALIFTLGMVFWPNSRLSHSHLVCENSHLNSKLLKPCCASPLDLLLLKCHLCCVMFFFLSCLHGKHFIIII